MNDRRPAACAALVCAAGSCVASVTWATPPEAPPTLLEPYAGYDVVFGPAADRVLGPEAAPFIEKMLTGPGANLAPGCALGDLTVEPARITGQVTCAGAMWSIAVRARTATDAGLTATAQFVLEVASPPVTCDAACLAQRGAVQAELARRVRAREATIPWQHVRSAPGSAAGRFTLALETAQRACATADHAAARRALTTAVEAVPIDAMNSRDLFDFALLAGEASAAAESSTAVTALQTRVTRGQVAKDPGPEAIRAAGELARAIQALAGEVTAAADAAVRCAAAPRPCDVIAVVRALAATHQFQAAARVLDAGPLRPGVVPPGDLLKLRFGLASALRDADAELALGRRWVTAWPDDPRGPDLVAAGLGRAGRYREAIETLHDLVRAHPERDIVLGRIAGLLAFLTFAAGQDAGAKADLDAIEARMQLAAASPTDLVARFVVATRAYYAGRLAEALPQLEALQGTGNRDPRLPLYLAMTHHWLGHSAVAVEHIERAVAIGPSDPDVFYCRSQIVRGWNLPLAIADLRRYEAMTSQPWSIGPKIKTDRVAAELACLERGELPPDWDKPGPDRVPFDPANQRGKPVSADVRAGTAPMPGAPTPTVALPPPPTPVGTAPDGQPRPRPDTPAPWLPWVLIASVAAALAVRWFVRKPPK
ncbi:MAG: hypothetical protein EXR79_09795 [Myxococcales bacterium]|nr:hypothetical protein [Myxococcales bacterium]